MGQCVQREWVVGGVGLNGHFSEQGLPMGVQDCLEGFHQVYVDHLSGEFVPKWYSPKAESVLATAGTTSILVELIGVATLPRRCGRGE